VSECVIENSQWQVGILPELGASLAFGRIKHENTWRDLLRPRPETMGEPWDLANFLLIPWSNRIKAGKFAFRGKTYRLRINCADHTTIHGTTHDFPWEVVEAKSDQVTLRFQSSDFYGINFPWRFSAFVNYALEDRRFVMTMGLKNEDSSAMPAGFGHHPYFVRGFASAEDMPQIQIPCERFYEAEDCIPNSAAVVLESHLDYRQLRPLEPIFINDVLTGRIGTEPIQVVYQQSGRAIRMTADPIFEHIIFYNPPEKPFFAIEPVTNCNDGFNMFERGIPGSGVFLLEPGEEKTGVVAIEIDS
jgi:aldose 1-epimerase